MTVESIPVGTLDRRASSGAHQHGYALYEVLVALSIIGLIALGIFLAFRAGTTTWTTSQQFVAEQQNARILVNTIARGVRMIGYQYTGGSSAVINAAASDVSFYADMDGDGSMECYRYYLSGGTVYEAVVQGSGCASSILTATGQPVTASLESKRLTVKSLTFTYYDADTQGGALLSTPLSATNLFLVRRVDVTATVQGVTSITPFTIDTQAVVRAGR
jgi:prepilin-type N-terminal cleavage/methylation domain-containing protein